MLFAALQAHGEGVAVTINNVMEQHLTQAQQQQTQLANTITQQQQQIAALAANIEALNAQAQAAQQAPQQQQPPQGPAPAAAAPAPEAANIQQQAQVGGGGNTQALFKLHVNYPKYSGKPSENIELFLKKVDQLFVDNNDDRHKKAVLGLNCLEGNAATWWNAMVGFHTQQYNAWSYDDLVAALKEAFCPDDPNTFYRNKLDKLNQSPGQDGLENYITTFTEYALAISGPGEGELLQRFLKGLLPQTREKVVAMAPESLNHATILARRFENLFQEYHRRPKKPTTPTHPSAMEIDNTEFGKYGRGRAQLRGGGRRGQPDNRPFKGACFNCEKIGHRAIHCKEPKKTDKPNAPKN